MDKCPNCNSLLTPIVNPFVRLTKCTNCDNKYRIADDGTLVLEDDSKLKELRQLGIRQIYTRLKRERVEIDQESENLKSKLMWLERAKKDLEQELGELQKRCPHSNLKSGSGDTECPDCGKWRHAISAEL